LGVGVGVGGGGGWFSFFLGWQCILCEISSPIPPWLSFFSALHGPTGPLSSVGLTYFWC